MKCSVLDLHPTQFSVGMREVAKKIARLRALDSDKRHEFLHEHPVPVVLAAEKRFFIIDHHHLVRSCWELGVLQVPVDQKADLSHLNNSEFWTVLSQSHWSHLYDQFGGGPHEPRLLPEDVRGLADDPYRSLAWALRHEGGYEKSDKPFAEFAWAQYLRAKIIILPGDEGFVKALREALKIAQDPSAHGLPGSK